jgi:hypothetical protein
MALFSLSGWFFPPPLILEKRDSGGRPYWPFDTGGHLGIAYDRNSISFGGGK